MAESETGLSDLMEDFDLEDINDTGYEKYVDVEIIDGFLPSKRGFHEWESTTIRSLLNEVVFELLSTTRLCSRIAKRWKTRRSQNCF